ncbi:MAG TPA: acyl-CoA dehydrogenase family protein [Myxococcota bacterium]|nr:acyl-CoA dehydrogenase family protein [Myxococcota bacterium]
MDLEYSPAEEAFRARVRAWLETNAPRARGPLSLEEGKAWQRKLQQGGFLGAAWPKEYGGAGLSDMEQAILNEELTRAKAPGVPGQMGIWWVGPAIMKFGSEAQKQRFVARILSGEDIWATGYSEPGAGSDMFNTQTRAERRGDHYVVNGQKIWTTIAHLSNWYFCLVRVPGLGSSKYDGLTVLLMEMNAPGMEVKPITQITGDSEFNEVFMTDARVPVENRLGAEGEGWKIISNALVNERNGIASGMRQDEALQRLIAAARRRGKTADPGVRQKIADLAIACAISKYSGYRAMTDGLHGRLNPHLSAAMKLAGTSLAQQMSTAHLSLLGAYGQLYENHAAAGDARPTAQRFLGDRAQTIAGGTSEIQKNIIAERILGLPRA